MCPWACAPQQEEPPQWEVCTPQLERSPPPAAARESPHSNKDRRSQKWINTILKIMCCFCSVAQSFLTVCDPMNCSTLGFPVLHHLPGLAQTHVHWVGDAIQPSNSSSVVPFSSCPESFTASGSFLMCWLFASGGQSIGASASASVLPMNIQDWFPLGLTGWISGCWNSHFHFNYHFTLYTSLFLLFMPFCVRTHLFPSLSAHP